MMLAKGEIGKELTFVSGAKGHQMITEMQFDLQKGTYLLYIELLIEGESEKQVDFHICAYSKKEIYFKSIPCGNERPILEKILGSCARMAKGDNKHDYGFKGEKEVTRSLSFRAS